MEEEPHCSPDDLYLPDLPGIYKFYNNKKEVIYVGKAKNIKKRVMAYFMSGKIHNLKTQRMVARIASIAYTVVNSEYEALLLENNLIKELQPRYNVLLKDDKSYPYLCITDELFPRLIVTRTTVPSLGKYYGPFTSSNTIRQTLEVIKKLFTFRTCSYNLVESSIVKKKFKVCLDYHLGHCKGPCEGLQSAKDYRQEIVQIEELLKNNFHIVKKKFKENMIEAAQRLDYKSAQRFKEKFTILEQYQAKSLIVHPTLGDLDVVAVISDPDYLFVGYLHVKQGAISFTQHRVVTKKLDEDVLELIALVVCALRTSSSSHAREVLVNLPLQLDMEKFVVSMPKIGDKRKLVDLALQNAFLCKKDFLSQKATAKERVNLVLIRLQQDLKLKELPYWIECFDNSNLQGDFPVAAMVCFKNGKPSKKSYRHYYIKTVVGPDDYASMYEIIQRRYSHFSLPTIDLPNLIVIDGGKGQLNAAICALKDLGIYGKIPIISIAKRLEEIYFPNDTDSLLLDKRSPSLKLLQQLRNEAHRFAISFHRNQRSKATLHNDWADIPGIGPKTIHKLLHHFGSPKMIEAASADALTAVIGRAKAHLLLDFFVTQNHGGLQ